MVLQVPFSLYSLNYNDCFVIYQGLLDDVFVYWGKKANNNEMRETYILSQMFGVHVEYTSEFHILIPNSERILNIRTYTRN